jgi:hypothetical protein
LNAGALEYCVTRFSRVMTVDDLAAQCLLEGLGGALAAPHRHLVTRQATALIQH